MNVQFKSPITGRLGGLVVGRQRGGITRCRPTGRREPFGPRRHRQSRASRSIAWTDRVDRPRGPTAWTDRVDRPEAPLGPTSSLSSPPPGWQLGGPPRRRPGSMCWRTSTYGVRRVAALLRSATIFMLGFLVHTRLAPHLEFPFHTRRRRQPSHFFISFIRYIHTAMRRASPTQLSLKANTNSGLFLVSTNKTRSGRARVVLSPQCRAVRSLLPTNDRSKGREMAGTRRIVGQRLQLRFSPTVPGRPLTTYVPHPRLHPLTHPPVPDYHRRARCDRCRSR